jgi:hypothetical protein
LPYHHNSEKNVDDFMLKEIWLRSKELRKGFIEIIFTIKGVARVAARGKLIHSFL